MRDAIDDFVDWIDGVVTRADDLVETAQGNHCLTRADGDWTRKIALSEGLRGQYDPQIINMMLYLLKMKNPTPLFDGDVMRKIDEFP